MSISKQIDNHGLAAEGGLAPGNSAIALPHVVNPVTDPATGAVYGQQAFVLHDKAGVNQAAVDAQGAQLVTLGGSKYQNCAAAAAQLVKTGAGRLCRIIVLATGTAAVTIYDNTAASGQPVFIVPASAATGSFYDAQVPVSNGIFVGGTTNTPQLLVTYN